ncbi:hypothetical protein P0136_06750 [Lentisphaerota bacterium ZTH]|nr:hypothetical protein JYG24_02140 [Lentisphaerota bacterium]WET07688.1 hypothetical protein P0136_06750 [Lentisphaerota bacterium ZTH]
MEELCREIALAIVNCAAKNGYIEGQIAVIEELADYEKELFKFMLVETRKFLDRECRQEISGEEIISLFTYVSAKAGEAVSCWVNGQTPEFSSHGMFDGKVPMYSDDKVMAYFKTLELPSDMAKTFSNWCRENPDFCSENHLDPIIPLFEALKWTWRIAVNLTVCLLEKQGFKF